MEESKPETEESEIEVDLDFDSNCKLDDRWSYEQRSEHTRREEEPVARKTQTSAAL